MVNDLVLTLAPGADRAAMRRHLQAALAARLPDVGATVLTTEDDEAYRILYVDIDGDQRLVTILAVIILGGAALAAFNLSSRLVEPQRRAIGVGMTLGVRPLRLAIRPLLFGAQVAVLDWTVGLTVAETMPELALRPALAPAITVIAFLSGVVAVAIAPLLTIRRLRRPDIPATLRVVE